MENADFIILGAGIMGVASAIELNRAFPRAKIVVFDKEPRPGLHASGRNSGVLHSGIYYAPGTLKAKLSATGAAELQEFCKELNLPLLRCGKLILPLFAKDFPTLDALVQRAPSNGVEAHSLDEKGILELEPYANAELGRGLWIPQTSVSDPQAVLGAWVEIARERGVEFRWSEGARDCAHDGVLLTTRGNRISYGRLINCAGVHALRLAAQQGVGKDFLLVPFIGSYFELSSRSTIRIQRLLYPTPNLEMPFLGVHFTPSPHGGIYIGPNARPALGKEAYGARPSDDWSSLPLMFSALLRAYLRNSSGIRAHTHQELKHWSAAGTLRLARRLVRNIELEDLAHSRKRGIRAQLMNRRKSTLEMDFRIESSGRSLHVLNAISPGYTTAFPFARWLLAQHAIA
jgi:L-2-hydroxyglutarate oxidase LhgO